MKSCSWRVIWKWQTLSQKLSPWIIVQYHSAVLSSIRVAIIIDPFTRTVEKNLFTDFRRLLHSSSSFDCSLLVSEMMKLVIKLNWTARYKYRKPAALRSYQTNNTRYPYRCPNRIERKHKSLSHAVLHTFNCTVKCTLRSVTIGRLDVRRKARSSVESSVCIKLSSIAFNKPSFYEPSLHRNRYHASVTPMASGFTSMQFESRYQKSTSFILRSFHWSRDNVGVIESSGHWLLMPRPLYRWYCRRLFSNIWWRNYSKPPFWMRRRQSLEKSVQ